MTEQQLAILLEAAFDAGYSFGVPDAGQHLVDAIQEARDYKAVRAAVLKPYVIEAQKTSVLSRVSRDRL